MIPMSGMIGYYNLSSQNMSPGHGFLPAIVMEQAPESAKKLCPRKGVL